MNTIFSIHQQDVDETYRAPADIEYKNRYAARAVLRNAVGSIALLHASVGNYYKLPGGGVEADEDMRKALARELLEEVGAVAEVTGEVGRVEEWRDINNERMHQISDAYTATVQGDVGVPAFTEKEKSEGFSVVWAHDIDHAILLVDSALTNPDPRIRFMVKRDAAILKALREQ